MTYRHPSKLTLLVLLTLTALVGCDPDPTPPPAPPAEKPYSEVQFDVTVPPETPVDAALFIKGSDLSLTGASGKGLELVYQGGNTFSAKTRLPKGEDITYTLHLDTPTGQQVALDAAGAVVPERTLKVEQDEENRAFTVERWGPAGGDTQPRLAVLVQVPETSPTDSGFWLSGNAPELGGSKPDGVKLYRAMNSRYAAVLSVATGTWLSFKVTRGAMDTEQVNPGGEDTGSHTHVMGSGLERLEVSVARWADDPSELTFWLSVPHETPAGAQVELRGSHAVFGGGAADKALKLVPQGDNVYSAKVTVRGREELTFNVWMTAPATQVERDASGALRTRTFKVRGDTELNVNVERWGPETGGSTEPQFVLVVAVPSNTPPDATIYVVGNQPQIGGWDPGAVPLYKTVNGRYAITLSFAPGTSLEYKLTRGSWDKVEKGPAGEEISNRTHTTGSGFERTFVTVAKWADLDGVPATPVLTGNIEYLREVTPTDTTLKKRDVIVWLPPDYKTNPERRYPVLYMHDGQNLMDATTGFAGEWGVDETAQQLVESGQVEPVIIVGIYNTGEDRILEYTPVPNPPKYGGGKADDYGKFLVEELKPLIDGKYRTKPEAEYTGLAGSSLGGLVSMYLGMKHSTTFTRLGVISPSVWWGNRDILTRVNALESKLPLRIWVDIGTAEGSSAAEETETVDDTRLLRDALTGKGWRLGEDLKYTEVEGGKHNEAAWAARFGDILEYLYPARP